MSEPSSSGDQRSGKRRKPKRSSHDRLKAKKSSRADFISRWGVVVAAAITAVGAITVAIISGGGTDGLPETDKNHAVSTDHSAQSSCAKGTLAVTSTIVSEGRGVRTIRVEGNWTGPPLTEKESVYAIARPVETSATTLDQDVTSTRGWYVSEFDVFRPDGSWEASIEIPRSERRDLVIQAICSLVCPEGQSCAVDTLIIDLRIEGETVIRTGA